MTQTSNRFYDRFARLMNDAASVAQGVRREATTMFRSQAERIANDMDLVKREDFDAVKDMARMAREENARLEARIAELEAQLKGAGEAKAKPAAARSASTTPRKRASAAAKPEAESSS